MIGLALSGGGVKGSYQIGSYMAFKKCGVKFSGIVGTSIGSFNGALLACHMEEELLDFWQNVDVGDLLQFDKKYLQKHALKKYDLEYLLLSIDNFVDILNNKGVSIQGLQRILADFALEEKLRKSDIEYGLSTFRLKDNKGLDLFIEDIPKGLLNNYIIASCYLPIFKQEKLMDDSFFFDGGIHNYCPINMLLERGYKKVYAIDLKAIGVKQKISDESKVVTISPSKKLSNLISLDQEKIRENIKMGYYDTLKVLKRYDGYSYVFYRRSNLYFKFISSRVSEGTWALACSYFNATNKKEVIIKAIEYMLKKDKVDYYEVYDINHFIKKYHSNNSKSIAAKLIKELKNAIL